MDAAICESESGANFWKRSLMVVGCPPKGKGTVAENLAFPFLTF